jgi:hypothetical protein
MVFDRFLAKAAELLAKGEPFVTAQVVRFEAPSLASRAIRRSFSRMAECGAGSAAAVRSRLSLRKR